MPREGRVKEMAKEEAATAGAAKVSPADPVTAVILTWRDRWGDESSAEAGGEPPWSEDLCAWLAEHEIPVKEPLYDNFLDSYLTASDAFEGLFLFRTHEDAKEFVRLLEAERTRAQTEIRNYANGRKAILDVCPDLLDAFWHEPSKCWVVRTEGFQDPVPLYEPEDGDGE